MTKRELMSKVFDLTTDDFITQVAYDKSFEQAFDKEPKTPFVSMLSIGIDKLDEVIPLCFTSVILRLKDEEQCVELANLLWSILSLDVTLKERCTLDEETRKRHATVLCHTSDHFLGHEVTIKALKVIRLL